MKRPLFNLIKISNSSQMPRFNLSIICFFVIVVTFIILSQAHAKAPLELGIFDFLYITDAGYDPQYNFEKNIERHIITTNIKSDISDFGLNDPNLVPIQVSRGTIEYFLNAGSSQYLTRIPYSSYDLVMWGLVVPWKWPQDYDVYMFLFTNPNKESYRVLDFALKVRNKRIVAWNDELCNLPEEAMAVIPEFMYAKMDWYKGQTGQLLNESQINGKFEQIIETRGYKFPVNAFASLLSWHPNDKKSVDMVGSLELELDQDRYILLDLPETVYSALEHFLIINKPLSWPLEQSGLVMPEINISRNNNNEYLPIDKVGTEFLETSADEFMIGILPLKNSSSQLQYDWIGFGFEYLLSNKLSAISNFRVLDREVFEKALTNSTAGMEDSNKVRIQNDIKTLGFNLGITGTYRADPSEIDINLDVINTIDGDTIFSRQYRNDYDALFAMSDQMLQDFVNLTSVSLSYSEKRMLQHRLTNSISSFKNFCMGYLENEKLDKNYDIIKKYFHNAVIDDPQFWEAQYNLGIAYYNNREHDRALRQFNDLIQQLPNFEKPYIGRGLTYMRLKLYDMAEQDLLTATRLAPNNYQSYYALGKLYMAIKKYSMAKNYLRRAAELNPGYGAIYYELGNIYYQQHQFKQALPYFRKAQEFHSENISLYQKMGECYYHVHSFNSAAEEFAKILNRYPDDAEANFMLGITVYKQAVLDEFINAFLEMMDININPDQKSKYPNNGLEVKRRRVYREMINRFEKAHLAKMNFYEATFNIALTYQEMGKIDSAIIYYEKTLEIIPTLVKANLMLGKLYELKDEPDKALENYRCVVREEPGYFINTPVLADEFDNVNIIELVMKELEDELRADPHDLEANLSLARIYYAQGYFGKAANLYRKVLSIYPENKNARKMLAQLGNM